MQFIVSNYGESYTGSAAPLDTGISTPIVTAAALAPTVTSSSANLSSKSTGRLSRTKVVVRSHSPSPASDPQEFATAPRGHTAALDVARTAVSSQGAKNSDKQGRNAPVVPESNVPSIPHITSSTAHATKAGKKKGKAKDVPEAMPEITLAEPEPVKKATRRSTRAK